VVALGDESAQCKRRQRLLPIPGDRAMPKPIATHELNDVALWLSSKKREEVFGGVVKHICSFVQSGDPSGYAESSRRCDDETRWRQAKKPWLFLSSIETGAG
jgi:hypothetical protein